MSSGAFREGMDSIAGFVEKIIKVFKDVYTFLKEQSGGISQGASHAWNLVWLET